mmetsp:Transcript_516/g.1812  ORF Transcript_516/g.1812 Transcript_516/m.1812 type:complete len:222 (-) Transcript_516:20502-21167(-)
MMSRAPNRALDLNLVVPNVHRNLVGALATRRVGELHLDAEDVIRVILERVRRNLKLARVPRDSLIPNGEIHIRPRHEAPRVGEGPQQLRWLVARLGTRVVRLLCGSFEHKAIGGFDLHRSNRVDVHLRDWHRLLHDSRGGGVGFAHKVEESQAEDVLHIRLQERARNVDVHLRIVARRLQHSEQLRHVRIRLHAVFVDEAPAPAARARVGAKYERVAHSKR